MSRSIDTGKAAITKTLHADGTEVASFYVRTIRSGPLVFLSGTTARDSSGKVRNHDAGKQTTAIMRKIERGLRSAGSALSDLTRLTIYVTDIRDMGKVSVAIERALKGTVVTSTGVGISALGTGAVVEIEATAVVQDLPMHSKARKQAGTKRK